MPPLVAVAAAVGGAWAAGAAISAGIAVTTAALIGTVVSMGISMIGNLALGSQDIGVAPASPFAAEKAQGILLNQASNNAAIPVIYGSRLVGGTRVFIGVSGEENEYLHMVLVLCEGRISAINTVYINDVRSDNSRFNGLVSIRKYVGTPTQAADSILVNAFPEWTSACQLKGVAYLAVRLKYDREAFSGLPTITADIDGKLVYDPRTDTTGFSANPALCVLDYLTNTIYGRGISYASIDIDTFKEEADFCDEELGEVPDPVFPKLFTRYPLAHTLLVASKPTAVPYIRYRCNGLLDTDNNTFNNTKNLLTSCRGLLIESNGMYRLKIDKEDDPIDFEFNESNIVGSWTIIPGSKANTFNRVTGTFFNKDASWQPDTAIIDSTTLRTLDNGLLLEAKLELPFTSDRGGAEQLLTIALNQSRQNLGVQFTATCAALECEVGDIVPITHSTPGWDGKLIRIMEMELQSNDEVRITVVEYNPSAYTFDEIVYDTSVPDTNLPDPFNVLPPSGVTISESLYVTRDGTGVKAKMTISWQATDSFTKTYQVEYKPAADSDYIILPPVVAPAVTVDVLDVAPGSYDVRVKAINMFDKSSTYASTTKTVIGLDAAPADVQNFSLNIVSNTAHLSWSKPTDLDVLYGGHIRVRHTPKTPTTASWESSADIGGVIAGNSTNAVLPLLAGTYLVKNVDSQRQESANAEMIYTNAPSMISWNAVATVAEAPSFTGTKTNMVVADPVLQFDIMSDTTTGSYTFPAAGYVDLGAVYTCRVVSNLDFTSVNTSDLFDSRSGLISTWPDFDNISSFTDVVASIYISTTDDDPAGTPVWSDWRTLVVGDYTTRAYKFKLECASGDITHQINIADLTITIDAPDRTQRGSGLYTSSSATTSISYDSSFKAVPALGLTVLDMATGDYVQVTSETMSGFDIDVRNSGGSRVIRKFNYLATSY